MQINIKELQNRPRVKDIADHLGISDNHLRKVLKGQKRASPKLAKRIMEMDPSGTLTYEWFFDHLYRGD